MKKVFKRKSPKQKKKGKLTLKKAAQAIAKTIYRHLVELPEKEREQNIAAVERALAKKFKQLRRRK